MPLTIAAPTSEHRPASRRHLKAKTTDEQWRVFGVEWQRYAAMLGGTADQQAAFAAAQAPQPAAAAGGGCCGGSGDSAAEAEEQQAAAAAEPGVASVTAAIATGNRDITEELLLHMSPDQRRQLVKLQQEALALGAEMLGKDASPLRTAAEVAAAAVPKEGGSA